MTPDEGPQFQRLEAMIAAQEIIDSLVGHPCEPGACWPCERLGLARAVLTTLRQGDSG